MNYKENLLDRLEEKSRQMFMVTLQIQGAMVDNDVKEIKKWIAIGDELQAEMEVLMLIHEVYDTRVN